jgi:hypothetical protein
LQTLAVKGAWHHLHHLLGIETGCAQLDGLLSQLTVVLVKDISVSVEAENLQLNQDDGLLQRFETMFEGVPNQLFLDEEDEKIVKNAISWESSSRYVELLLNPQNEFTCTHSSNVLDDLQPIVFDESHLGFQNTPIDYIESYAKASQSNDLACYRCEHYRPISTMFIQHAAEVFKMMLLFLDGERAAHNIRRAESRDLVKIETNRLANDLNEARSVFARFFNLAGDQVDNLYDDLWGTARTYRKNNPEHPITDSITAMLHIQASLPKWQQLWDEPLPSILTDQTTFHLLNK